MGLPTQRRLNGDLDSGLDDGRSRQLNPNWGGDTSARPGPPRVRPGLLTTHTIAYHHTEH
jgi:hypothetical protein